MEKTPLAENEAIPRGIQLLHDNFYNKGTAFTLKERKVLGLEGLLPPAVFTIEEQVMRILENFRKKPSDIEKYIFLTALMDRNLTLFYRTLIDNIEEMLPIIYTPTVGQACMEFSHIFRRPNGLFLTAEQKGRFSELMGQWHEKDIKVIVVTDGERILGLGDLGAAGMGIPIGKLTLYTVCAGIHHRHCLPVLIDVGTHNVNQLNDPLYIGLRQDRIRGDLYDEILDEFTTSARENFPGVLIQFEDFGNRNAFRVLTRYRRRFCCFNDDIQGTACVTLAGLYNAMRVTKASFKNQRILFLGAGEAGIGIGEMIVAAMLEEGLPLQEAREKCWFVDSKGLIVKDRDYLTDQKKPFAHGHPHLPDLLSSIQTLRPTVLIGVSGLGGAFNRKVLKTMAEINRKPIIFALSNPTSKSECTAAEAYTWTEGRAVFASGSPFPASVLDGKALIPSQANNAYVFPGVGLGVIESGASQVTDAMFLAAAQALATQVSAKDIADGLLYPSFQKIRHISTVIAAAVAQMAADQGLANKNIPGDYFNHMQTCMYDPRYVPYV
ncbi:MAG: NAD-dependent malic enzyme [Deltaproteobacteria bacterium]|nr:NAD-dependent malic enzyme [Deltaproteobacteria bacterium]